MPDLHLWWLAETLTCEYAGAVAADVVVRAVSSAARTLRDLDLSDDVYWDLTEQTARRELTNLLARL
ncbi:hypothetical protein [Jiangella mangrovi]|uniref:Uncharacterized protein n=1 Tax=Jiangella mangrovi TaxID=1524084 RepID=A0A7W9GS77_9ACTN|nr:hypothetical protein [Jiangella mangrovi]MBB5788784.1 hypothetical protein [Jiangella mangrovi]